MLVLSRQRDEEIVIEVPPSSTPTTVRVTVVDVKGEKVRLGIDAPKEVPVHRKEVYNAIQREREQGTGGKR